MIYCHRDVQGLREARERQVDQPIGGVLISTYTMYMCVYIHMFI